MNTEQKVKLKAELTTDPAGIGYAAVIGDHVELARMIHAAERQVPDTSEVPAWKLRACFDLTELKAAYAIPLKARQLQGIESLSVINPDNNRLRAELVDIFTATSQTLIRFDKLAKRTGTRAEELGFNRVTESDVADALRE